MKTLDDARELAETMVEIGAARGPRGRRACSPTWTSRSAARSATRSRSARRSTAPRRGPGRLRRVRARRVARLLALSDMGIDVAEARRRAETAVGDGSAFAVYERWIRGPGRRSRSTGARRCAGAPLGSLPRQQASSSPWARWRWAWPHLAWAPGADEGGRDRPQRWRALLREARRRRARERRPGGGARTRRGVGTLRPSRQSSRPTRSPTRRRPSAGSCSTGRLSRDRPGASPTGARAAGASSVPTSLLSRAGAARGRDRAPVVAPVLEGATPRGDRDSRSTPSGRSTRRSSPARLSESVSAR